MALQIQQMLAHGPSIMDASLLRQMGITGQVAMASSKVQMRAKHGSSTMLQSTARGLAMTADIPWFNCWELIVMEVQILAVQWLGLMLIASQAENEFEGARVTRSIGATWYLGNTSVSEIFITLVAPAINLNN